MARCAFVKPETVDIQLSEGDWIRVKKYLASGEEKRLQGAGLVALRSTQQEEARSAFELDFVRLGLATIEAYVVEWSFTDFDGNQTKPTPENIAALDPSIEREITAALKAHLERMAGEAKRPRPATAGAPN